MGTNWTICKRAIQICNAITYLDEEVGDQGSKESSNSDVDVLGEDDALGLNDEEIDKLLNIVKETLKRSLGDGEVCLLYTSPSPRDGLLSRMPSSA